MRIYSSVFFKSYAMACTKKLTQPREHDGRISGKIKNSTKKERISESNLNNYKFYQRFKIERKTVWNLQFSLTFQQFVFIEFQKISNKETNFELIQCFDYLPLWYLMNVFLLSFLFQMFSWTETITLGSFSCNPSLSLSLILQSKAIHSFFREDK